MLNSINNLQMIKDPLKELLEQNTMEELVKNIEKFSLDRKGVRALLDKALEAKCGCSIIDNIEKFDLNEDDRFKIAVDLIENLDENCKKCIDNIDKFDIKNREYKICLANKLLKLNRGDFLINNMEKFKLDKKDIKKILEKGVQLNYGYNIIDNMEKFNLDEYDRLKIAIDLIENLGGNGKKFIDNIDKFDITSLYHRFNLAKMLVKENGYNVVENIHKFKFDACNICKILQEILLREQNYLLFVNKIKDFFADCGEESIIYVNKCFNLVMAQKNLICVNGEVSFGNALFCKSVINFYYNTFECHSDICEPEITNKIHCDGKILNKTIGNFSKLDEFCFDINLDMDKILGYKNAQIIKDAIKKVTSYQVRFEINIIVEKILFSYDNIYIKHQYQDELTKLILEIVLIKEPRLKELLLPLVIKYINDGNLEYLSNIIKNEYKVFNAVFEVLLERLRLYDSGNEDLLLKLRKKFKSSNFLRNSINVQKVIEALIALDKLSIRIDKCKSIISFLCANITNITRNMQYIFNIIRLGYDEELKRIREDLPEDALKNMYYKLYDKYLKMYYGNDFIESYEKFMLEEVNEKRNLEEHIMTYVVNSCNREEIMEVIKKFLTTMYDIKKFRKLRYNANHSKHLKTIQEINRSVYEKWIMNVDEYKEKQARITDDPVDLFLIGTEIDGSCLRVGASIEYNKCLMAYVVDGKNKAVVISENNKIIARSIIRLLLVKRSDESKHDVVMIMEKIYKMNGVLDADCVYKLRKRCIDYAKWMEVSLLYDDEEINPIKKVTVELSSKSCMSPYEYFDVGGDGVNDNGEQIFIKNLVYLYKEGD